MQESAGRSGREYGKALTVLQKKAPSRPRKSGQGVVGVIEAYAHYNKKSESLEIKSESDFVSGNEEFRTWPKISLCISPPQVHPI